MPGRAERRGRGFGEGFAEWLTGRVVLEADSDVGLFGIALLVFIVAGIAASVAQNRYYQALAKESQTVSSNEEVLDEFLGHPTRMPAANARETKRRLRALVTRQSDAKLERMRREALVAVAFASGAFVSILFVASLR